MLEATNTEIIITLLVLGVGCAAILVPVIYAVWDNLRGWGDA